MHFPGVYGLYAVEFDVCGFRACLWLQQQHVQGYPLPRRGLSNNWNKVLGVHNPVVILQTSTVLF